MIKRELKANFKSFMIWTLIIVLLFCIVFMVYPSIINDNKSVLDGLVNTLPKDMLALFNMDVISITSVFGWIASEGYLIITILGACYAAILGSTIVLREEDEGTIEFLYAKPISRGKILFNKIVVSLLYLLLFNLCIGLTNIIGISLIEKVDSMKVLLLTISPVIMQYLFFFISLLISIYFTKTRKSMMVSLGVVFMTYIFKVMGGLSAKLELLKYFSPFEYMDSRTVITDASISIPYLLLSLTIIIVTVIGVFSCYNKKNFNS